VLKNAGLVVIKTHLSLVSEHTATERLTGTQDRAAGGIPQSALDDAPGTEVPFCPCSRLQHVPHSTPSHFSKETPSFSSIGHEHLARGRCCSVSKIVKEIVRI